VLAAAALVAAVPEEAGNFVNIYIFLLYFGRNFVSGLFINQQLKYHEKTCTVIVNNKRCGV
ncbi:MAG: hypothetical protein ACOVRN_00100, partial [Flavobacterium sp.]